MAIFDNMKKWKIFKIFRGLEDEKEENVESVTAPTHDQPEVGSLSQDNTYFQGQFGVHSYANYIQQP